MPVLSRLINSTKLKEFTYSSPLGALVRPFHAAYVNALVQWVVISHRLAYGVKNIERLNENTTLIVKTFNRPRTMSRFHRTIRDVFQGRIVVADDSRKTWKAPDSTTTVVDLPFNSGVTVGRNKALAQVTTRYVIVADDDTIFSCATDWSKAYDYLESHPEVDIVAATLIELPKYVTWDLSDTPLYTGHDDYLLPIGTDLDGFRVMHKVPNVFMARTEQLKSIGWDENIRMLEHADFFSEAAGKLLTVQTEQIPTYHARTPWKKQYTRYRDDTDADKKYLAHKWRSRAQEKIGRPPTLYAYRVN